MEKILEEREIKTTTQSTRMRLLALISGLLFVLLGGFQSAEASPEDLSVDLPAGSGEMLGEEMIFPIEGLVIDRFEGDGQSEPEADESQTARAR